MGQNKINTALLDILVCPKCREKLREEPGWLVCTRAACALRYPIRDGIPIMLIEEAIPPGPPHA